MMTPYKFLSTACPQTREAALENQTNLQRLEAAPSLSIYLTMWVLVEQELNTLRLNGRFDEADAGQAEFDRICAEVGPRLRRQDYDSIRTYTLAEMAELSKPATLNDVTSIVCADILSGTLGSYGRVA